MINNSNNTIISSRFYLCHVTTDGFTALCYVLTESLDLITNQSIVVILNKQSSLPLIYIETPQKKDSEAQILENFMKFNTIVQMI